jgi:hypothetical protein
MQEQPYFTEGSADLKASRRLIADYSLRKCVHHHHRPTSTTHGCASE